ncbi:MAG TPA: OsmC family peroxiredoxin [Gaiellaceae bacterium]|nr:OsmC family peroxiredoxin [Gaiellaceae bacterium]
MPRIEREAQVVWEGNVARGSGRITASSGAFGDLPYTMATRVGAPEGKTSPEELLAAAHAGCLTMSIASELSQAGTPPARLEVTARIVMDEVAGDGHQIVASHVTVAGDQVPDEILERADAGCPFSTLLRKAGAAVTITRA